MSALPPKADIGTGTCTIRRASSLVRSFAAERRSGRVSHDMREGQACLNKIPQFEIDQRTSAGAQEFFAYRSDAPAPDGHRVTINKGELKMNISEKLFLTAILTLSFAWPVQAQPQGDYYAPGPSTVVHSSQGQLKSNAQGDYYVGDKMILSKRRAEALKKCTHMKAFESDGYVTCMAKEGEAP